MLRVYGACVILGVGHWPKLWQMVFKDAESLYVGESVFRFYGEVAQV